MIAIGVIGYSGWGPNLVCNFAEVRGARVTYAADARRERLAITQARYPRLRVSTNPQDPIEQSSVDAVVVATPVSAVDALAARR